MKLEQFKIGTKCYYWFDTGAMGAQPVYCEVIKIGKKKIKLRDQYGGEAWKYPQFIDGIVSEKAYRESTENIR